MTLNKIFKTMLLSSAILVFASGCGDDDEAPAVATSPATGGQQPQQPQTEDGVYTAQLQGANTSVAGNTNGAVEVTVKGDNVTVRVQVAGAPVAMHAQHIHTGTACPTPANDTNADGIIDAVEAGTVSGKVLVPFDDDINSQDAGKDVYPTGPVYTYEKTGSHAQMISDLTLPDPNPADEAVKLPAGTTLIGLQGKVVEIHGVPPTTNLPSTVASDDPTKSPHQVLPIACGVLTKVQL
jgi:hypothetical protein